MVARRARLFAAAMGIGLAATATGSVATAGQEDCGQSRRTWCAKSCRATRRTRLRSRRTARAGSRPGSTIGTSRSPTDSATATARWRARSSRRTSTSAGRRRVGGISVFLCTNLGQRPRRNPTVPCGTSDRDWNDQGRRRHRSGQSEPEPPASTTTSSRSPAERYDYVNVHSSAFPAVRSGPS